jgi:predicted transcriptional regulator
MATPVQLTPTQQRRLARIATEAGCAPQDLLSDVFKYGIEWVEADVRETLAGIAEAEAGDRVSNVEVARRVERTIKAASARKQKQAA